MRFSQFVLSTVLSGLLASAAPVPSDLDARAGVTLPKITIPKTNAGSSGSPSSSGSSVLSSIFSGKTPSTGKTTPESPQPPANQGPAIVVTPPTPRSLDDDLVELMARAGVTLPKITIPKTGSSGSSGSPSSSGSSVLSSIFSGKTPSTGKTTPESPQPPANQGPAIVVTPPTPRSLDDELVELMARAGVTLPKITIPKTGSSGSSGSPSSSGSSVLSSIFSGKTPSTGKTTPESPQPPANQGPAIVVTPPTP